MDKRWYGIIIILIVGLGSMFLVVNSSTTVGSAVIIVNDVSVALPHNFKILHNQPDESELQNRDNNETIYIKYLCDGNKSSDEFKKALKDDNLDIVKNTTNSTLHTIYCKNQTGVYTLNFFEKCDRTIMIKMSYYNDTSKMNDDLNYIIDSIMPDYKQSRS